jgi:hypothetical protein
LDQPDLGTEVILDHRRGNRVMKTERRMTPFTLSFLVTLAASVSHAQHSPNITPGAASALLRYDETSMSACTGAIMNETNAPADLRVREADKGGYVLLAPGKSVQWKAKRNAGGIILRYSIDDAPTGGGIDAVAVISNLATHESRALSLTSKHAWLYGSEMRETNDPGAGSARRLFDHLSAKLGVRHGDTLAIRNPNENIAVCVDFLETDEVPPPVPCPPGAVVVSGSAIQEAIRAASVNQTVYLPAGDYNLTNQIYIDKNITVQGAGMWHTKLHARYKKTANGFVIVNGATVTFRGFHMLGNSTLRHGPAGESGSASAIRGTDQHGMGSGTLIDSVWVDHYQLCFVLQGRPEGSENIRILNTRVFDCYADGMTIFRTIDHFLASNNTVRQAGDDAFGLNSGTNNVFCFNTAEFTARAGGLGLFGGSRCKFFGNLIRNTLPSAQASLRVSTVFLKKGAPGPEFCEFYDNRIERCNGKNGQLFLQFGFSTMSNLSFSRNSFHDACNTNGFLVIQNIPWGTPSSFLIEGCVIKDLALHHFPLGSPLWNVQTTQVNGRIFLSNVVEQPPLTRPEASGGIEFVFDKKPKGERR